MRVRSEHWTIDTTTRQLTRGRGTAHVSPKAFELLTTLIAERPRALSKPELQRRLWPDTFVSEASLASLVAEVRSALGDSARKPRYVRTVHRYGYAFCGTVREENEPPPVSPRTIDSMRLILGEREIALAPGEHVLGRTREAMVWVDAPDVSRRHARITASESGVLIEDLASKNGTFVNDMRLDRPLLLSDGDEIRLGSVRIAFRVFAAPPSTETSGD